MERTKKIAVRTTLQRLAGSVPPAWRAGILFSAVSLLVAVTVAFAALHLQQLSRAVAGELSSQVSDAGGLPDVRGSLCSSQTQARIQATSQ